MYIPLSHLKNTKSFCVIELMVIYDKLNSYFYGYGLTYSCDEVVDGGEERPVEGQTDRTHPVVELDRGRTPDETDIVPGLLPVVLGVGYELGCTV